MTRTLHLVDVENLVGSGRPTETEVAATLDGYRALIPLGAEDHVVLAASRSTAASAGWAWPGALVRASSGPDGADLALLEDADPDFVSRRFQRVVIASGDHLFTELATKLHERGVRVEVTARGRSFANTLRMAADVVRLLPEPTRQEAA